MQIPKFIKNNEKVYAAIQSTKLYRCLSSGGGGGYAWGTKEWFEERFDCDKLDTDGDEWGLRWRAGQQVRYDKCLDMIYKSLLNEVEQNVLDIGCALCDFTSKVYSVNLNNHIYISDISNNAINYDRVKFPQFKAECVALPKVPFPDTKFDIIICLECLYYLDDTERRIAIDNIQKSLKPNGMFLLSGNVNNGDKYFEEQQICALISEYFDIKSVKYMYNRIYDNFERPFYNMMKLLSRFGRGRGICCKLLKRLMMNKKVVLKLNHLCCKLYGEKGRTHIIILCNTQNISGSSKL